MKLVIFRNDMETKILKEDEKSEADSHSKAEVSQNKNIPEVNIESPDENEEDKQSANENVSDNKPGAKEDNKESDDDSDDESEIGDIGHKLIRYIFRDSDDDEEFDGFYEEELGAHKSSLLLVSDQVNLLSKLKMDMEKIAKDEKDEEMDEEHGIIEDVPAPSNGEKVDVNQEEPPKKKKKVESDDPDKDGVCKMRKVNAIVVQSVFPKAGEENSNYRLQPAIPILSSPIKAVSKDGESSLVMPDQSMVEKKQETEEASKQARRKLVRRNV